jgi:hypothetical protein
MYGQHLNWANITLFFLAGSLIVVGSAFVLTSQFRTLADYWKARGRHDRAEAKRATSPLG